MNRLIGTPRVGVAGMWQETNTYAARQTTLADAEAFELTSGEELLARHRGVRSVIGGFVDAGPPGIVPVFSAGAWPAGPADRATTGALLDRLGRALAAARPLDGVLLNLHGAMVCDGHPDMEHDVVAVIRDALGEVPVVAVLDFHGNPSPAFVRACDAVIAYDTYPHVDMWERGVEGARLMDALLGGRRLRTLVRKLPLLTCPLAQATDVEPMAGLQARARKLAAEAGLARVNILGGFPYSDVERAGVSVLLVHDEDRSAAAEKVGEAIVGDIERHRGDFWLTRDAPQTAVRRARESGHRPVVLVDVADNVGGGSPGDGTLLLAELLRQRADGAVVTLADPEVAGLAARLGPGAAIEASVGGKTDGLHGEPVPVRGRVERVTDGRYRSAGTWMTGREFTMGTTAVIQADGVTIVMTSRSLPPFHGEQLTSVGVDPAGAAIIVAKGHVAWRTAYGDVAAEVIEVDTPGICPIDPTRLPRATTPMRA